MSWAQVRRLALLAGGLLAIAGPVAATLWVSTPSGDDVQRRVEEMTASYGVVLLQPDQLPPTLVKAIVATEDERFYQHHGIDTLGALRAGLYDLTNLCLCQGGSTITEQLVKDVYLHGSDRGLNKIIDMVLALKVEGVLTKQQIMADYLSEISTGYGKRGMPAAACAYFNAPLSDLTLGQYALLAGVAQAPSVYDPTVNPDLAQQRRAQVLRAMESEGYITREEAKAAGLEPVLVAATIPRAECS